MTTSTKTNPDAESIQSGIAALEQTADPFSEPGPFDVSGLAMPENVITHGGSGTTRMWPAETLRDAADMLEGKSIVADFHPASPEQAPAGNIVGKITEAGYEDGVGLRFSGEVTDQDIAKKIDRDYLEVSTRPAIAEEQYDADQDLYVVESIADFLDIGLVDWGAAGGNEVGLGSDPAVAALARSAIGYRGNYQYNHDALQRSEARTPSYSGTRSSDSWPDGGPSLSDYIDGYYDQADADPDDQPSQWGDLPQEARNWIASKTLLGDSDASSADDGISYPVVYPDEDLSESGLESARSMAGQAPSEQAADSIRSVTATLLENEFGHDIDDNEANAAVRQMTVPTAALQEDGDGGETRLDVWSDFLADLSGSVDVDEISFDNLHRLLASEIPGADISDVAGALPADSFDEGFGAADARELISDLANQDGDSDESGESESEGEDEDDTESNTRYAPGLTGALQRELNLTGSTPDRCFSIKSGAQTIDVNESALARDVLNIPDEDRRPKKIDIHESPIARDILNIEDDDELETIDINESPVDRKALGIEEPDPAEEMRPESEKDREVEMVDIDDEPIFKHLLGIEDEDEDDKRDPATKSFGDRVRKRVQEDDGPEKRDIYEDPVSRQALDIEKREKDKETETDSTTKSFGDDVRADGGDSGGDE